jgi:putative ABC transport system substrate-binding protein
MVDPVVASRIVPGLSQPGGNITGFASYEATFGGKWLELLSGIAPGLKRAAIMFNPYTAHGPDTQGRANHCARSSARNNVPAVYTLSAFVRDGGLLSYGPDLVDTFRRAASYVDRILRGEKPRDLPVQLPTGRSRQPPGCCDHCDRHPCGTGSQGGDIDDSDRLQRSR